MRLTYRQIEYLREVSRQDSIAAACKVLSISQSSVLAAIDVAEDATGTRLFTRRKGHGIKLTPAGRTFLISARRFLESGEEFARSLEQFSEATSKALHIACFVPFGALLIPPVIRRLIDQYGDCDFTLLEGDQTQLRTWLAEGKVDLIVTYDIGQEFGSSTTPICTFPTHAIVCSDDPIAKQDSVSMSQLAERPLILLDLPETRSYLMALFDLVARRPKIGLRTRSYETLRSAVSSGLNVRPTSNLSPDGANLVRIPIADPLRQPTLLVADPYGDQKPANVQSFITALHQHFVDLGPDQFAVVLPEFSNGLLYPAPGSQHTAGQQ